MTARMACGAGDLDGAGERGGVGPLLLLHVPLLQGGAQALVGSIAQ